MAFPHETYCISAHRAGALLQRTVQDVVAGGVEVIVAGAGLAAALPGAIAGMTAIPVIGVPLAGEGGLGGLDALLSIVQMPSQIPVATVGINNAKNAGYLAVEMLSVKYPELRERLFAFRKRLSDDAEHTLQQFR